MLGRGQIAEGKRIQRRTGKTFHVATRVLPERIRRPTYVLYGFFRMADEVVDAEETAPPEKQRAELDRLRRAALGEEPTDDPVLDAFATVREERGIADEDVHAFVDAMESDIDTDRYETYADLEAYMDGSAAAVGRMMTAIMEIDEPETALPHATKLGEAFLMTDWDESIRRIQFHRKRTFDAGATPGLDDFERPELKSVSSDLVSELESISDEQARRESELADLRQELDTKRSRIKQLERELEEARDLSNMADQFAQALLGKAEAPYRGGNGRNLADPDGGQVGLADYDGSDTESVGEDGHGTVTDDAADETNREGGEKREETDHDAVVDGDPDLDEGSDVDPVTRADVAEGALRFDDAMELGTRTAVIDELRSRIESLPELSRAMLRHYRREGVSEPIAAHIDSGGDGDSGHAYSRHRPIRKAGLIRHAGRGHYAYAVPDLIRDAYADRLDDDAVREMVREVETAFVPPAERSYAPDTEPSDLDVGSRSDADGTVPEPDTAKHDVDESAAGDGTVGRSGGLSEAARQFVDRDVRSSQRESNDPTTEDRGGAEERDGDAPGSIPVEPDDETNGLDDD